MPNFLPYLLSLALPVPSGMCTAQSKKSLFSARSNSARRISNTSTTSSSCPNSPRRSRLSGAGMDSASCSSASAVGDLYLKGLTEDEVVDELGTSLSQSFDSSSNSSSSRIIPSGGIHRSATTNAVRPRTAPAGLYSYTGECLHPSHKREIILWI